MRIAILIGSMSDEEKMRPCSKVLDSLGIEHIFTVTSAHRTLERTERVIRECEERGCQIFICAAGLAAHLAGAVAARTIKPVIGVPLSAPGSALGGLDAMLSTVQMPPGYPVATVALDGAGAKNAAWLAASILALGDPELAARIRGARDGFASDVETSAAKLGSKL